MFLARITVTIVGRSRFSLTFLCTSAGLLSAYQVCPTPGRLVDHSPACPAKHARSGHYNKLSGAIARVPELREAPRASKQAIRAQLFLSFPSSLLHAYPQYSGRQAARAPRLRSRINMARSVYSPSQRCPRACIRDEKFPSRDLNNSPSRHLHLRTYPSKIREENDRRRTALGKRNRGRRPTLHTATK